MAYSQLCLIVSYTAWTNRRCVIIVAILFLHSVASMTTCPVGQYLYIPERGESVCMLCPDGTYMAHDNHQYTKCFDCMKVKDDKLEILISNCNRTRDSVIHCVDGYYRRLPRNSREKERCEKCTECSFPTLPCRIYEDTHCCQGENYDVVPNHHGVPVCVERRWLCRQGEYFDPGSFLCKNCPKDTYMPLDYHSISECLKCHGSSKEDLPKHGIILQPCNETHQAVVGCEDGYFIDHTMGHNGKDLGCSSCKNCSSDDGIYLGRECGLDFDTVCCPQPNMTVDYTSAGLKCTTEPIASLHAQIKPTPELTVCSENEYLYQVSTTTTTICLPCPNGTFMDESKHNNTKCKQCTEFRGRPYPPTCDLNTVDHEQTDNVGILVGLVVTSFVIGGLLVGVVCFFCHDKINKLKYGDSATASSLPKDCGETKRLLQSDTRDRRSSTSYSEEYKKTNLHSLDCEKNSMHHQFIPVNEFREMHLPEGWRDVVVENYIRATADLTGMVSYTSEGRSNRKPKYADRQYATGMIYRVARKFADQDGTCCPCKSCERSDGDAKIHWGQIEVVTSIRCVCDDDDAQHTKCRLWYDSDGEDSGFWLQGVSVRHAIMQKDMCIINCITHDQDVSDKIETMVERWDELRAKLTETCKSHDEFEESLTFIIAHPHRSSKHITIGHLVGRDKTFPHRFAYCAETCMGSLGAPVSILGWNRGPKCLLTTHYGPRCKGVNVSSGYDLLLGGEETVNIDEEQASMI